jgi:hypothetical protein
MEPIKNTLCRIPKHFCNMLLKSEVSKIFEILILHYALLFQIWAYEIIGPEETNPIGLPLFTSISSH